MLDWKLCEGNYERIGLLPYEREIARLFIALSPDGFPVPGIARLISGLAYQEQQSVKNALWHIRQKAGVHSGHDLYVALTTPSYETFSERNAA